MIGLFLMVLLWSESPCHVLLITVDTLRFDHLSINGYGRQTSPNMDELFEQGVQFTQMRVVEPLTSPSLTSLLTSRYPHEHGATRNGIPVRMDLDALPLLLKRQRGYQTAAFVGNWTLKPHLSGLQEYFETYQAVTSRKRWFGLFKSEADASDLNDAALSWLEERRRDRQVFLWIHYIEPHAPYRYWSSFADQIGATSKRKVDRYDTEIAFVDAQIGHLVRQVKAQLNGESLMIVLIADHGESLGEHGEWGHGRHLFDTTLRVPAAIVWPQQLQPRIFDRPSLNIDFPSTILGLLGLTPPPEFRGMDLSPALHGSVLQQPERTLLFQAHKGAVQSRNQMERVREGGLLEVGILENSVKEVYSFKTQSRTLIDLHRDPLETDGRVSDRSEVSAQLARFLTLVEQGLSRTGVSRDRTLSEEDMQVLRSLGYLE